MGLFNFLSGQRGPVTAEDAACYEAWVQRGQRPLLQKANRANILGDLISKAHYWLGSVPSVALDYCKLFFEFARPDDPRRAELVDRLIERWRRAYRSEDWRENETAKSLKQFLASLTPSAFPPATEVALLVFGREARIAKFDERYEFLRRIAELGDQYLLATLQLFAGDWIDGRDMGAAISSVASQDVIDALRKSLEQHISEFDAMVDDGRPADLTRVGRIVAFYLAVLQTLVGAELVPLIEAQLRKWWQHRQSMSSAEERERVTFLVDRAVAYFSLHPSPQLEPLLLDVLSAKVRASDTALDALVAGGLSPARSEDLLKRLFDILDDPNMDMAGEDSITYGPSLVCKVARLLRKHKLPSAVPRLVHAAQFDWKVDPHSGWQRDARDAAVSQCLRALGEIGGGEAIDFLLTCLPARAAVVMLANHKEARAVEPLINAYKPTHYGSGSEFSCLVVWALGAIGDPRGINTCRRALHDEVIQVRMMGFLALRELAGAEQAQREDTAYGGSTPARYGRGDLKSAVYEGRESYSTLEQYRDPQ